MLDIQYTSHRSHYKHPDLPGLLQQQILQDPE